MVKQTDWSSINIGSDATLKARIGWQGLTTNEYKDNGEYYLVTGTDFENGLVNWDTCHFVDKWRYTQDKNIQLKESDVLITKDGTIGKAGFVESLTLPATLNSGVFVIRANPEKIHQKYLYYIFTSKIFDEFLNRLTAGSTINHLYQKDFIFFTFNAPKIEEQKAIASALSDVDALITSLEKLIAKKESIKTATMQQLLTGKKRLDGFSGEWEEKKLGEIVTKFQNGYAFNASGYFKTGIPIVTMAQIGLDGTFKFDENKVNYWSKNISNQLKDFFLKKGDLIMAMTDVTPDKNLIGRMTIVQTDKKCLLNQRVGHLILNKDEIDPLFLATLSNMKDWRIYAMGIASLGVQANIGTKDILNGIVKIPSLSEQQAIAKILSDMDNEIEVLKIKLSKTKAIKDGMMSELLSGKTRLKA